MKTNTFKMTATDRFWDLLAPFALPLLAGAAYLAYNFLDVLQPTNGWTFYTGTLSPDELALVAIVLIASYVAGKAGSVAVETNAVFSRLYMLAFVVAIPVAAVIFLIFAAYPAITLAMMLGGFQGSNSVSQLLWMFIPAIATALAVIQPVRAFIADRF
jgi:hypothetical protein